MLLELNTFHSNTRLLLCGQIIFYFEISQPRNVPPPHCPPYLPSLILLTFLPPSCPIPHLCSLSLLPPPLPSVPTLLICTVSAQHFDSVFTFETRKTPTLRSERRGVGRNSGVQGDLHHLYKILFHTKRPQSG